jgi:hypothetical protein
MAQATGTPVQRRPVTVSSPFSSLPNGPVHQCSFCFGVGHTQAFCPLTSAIPRFEPIGARLFADCQASSQPGKPTGISPIPRWPHAGLQRVSPGWAAGSFRTARAADAAHKPANEGFVKYLYHSARWFSKGFLLQYLWKGFMRVR